MSNDTQTIYKLALVVHHPVPYQVAFYRALQDDIRINETVLFLNQKATEANYQEEWRTAIKWDVPLLDGYNWKFLKNIGWSSSSPLFYFINPGLLFAIAFGKYDSVMITGYVHLSAYLAIFAAKLLGKKVILRAEADLGNKSTGLRRVLKYLFLGIILKTVDAVMYSCMRNRDYFRYYKVPEEKLFPILSSVDNEFYQKRRQELIPKRNELRIALGISVNANVILNVARFTERKCPFDLLQAFAKLKKEGENENWLVFVGDGPQREQLEVMANDLGLKNILFVGFKNTSEISTYYVISDIFVLPSMYDPTPKALNEALLFGLPVVVSDSVGTANDLVQHQVNGLIYPVGDVDKLAFEIDRLISDKELYSRLSKVAEDSVAGWSPCANVDGVVAALDFCHKGNGS